MRKGNTERLKLTCQLRLENLRHRFSSFHYVVYLIVKQASAGTYDIVELTLSNERMLKSRGYRTVSAGLIVAKYAVGAYFLPLVRW